MILIRYRLSNANGALRALRAPVASSSLNAVLRHHRHFHFIHGEDKV